MPSVITDPQAYARAIMARRRALQEQAQSGITSAPIVPPGVVSPQPQQTLDPAQAAAQGYRIPGDYIPDAQTAGGSGDYMSKVPSGAPQPSRGGIGSDYVAGGPQSPDVAFTGSIAAQDNGGDIFSFFGKPQATDAMTAFGAAMLKGRNFAEGLADASTAVNNVATKYRPYSDSEVQRMMQEATIKARINQRLNSAALQKGDIWYSPDGRAYREVFNPNSPNGSSFKDITSPDGKMVESLPPGSTQRVDSPMGERNAAAAKFETQARDNADQAFQDLNSLDEILKTLPTSGAGPDLISKGKRALVTATGINLDGVNLSDMQVLNSKVKEIELTRAQTQRGLGQLTQPERDIIRESLATIDSDPEAAKRILAVLRNRAEKAQQLYEDWLSMPSDVKSSQYNGSFENFAYFWKKQNYNTSKSSGSNSSQSGNKPSLDDIFK